MLNYYEKGLQKESVQPLVPLRRLRMTTKVMKGFMKVICVILCLIISTTVYTGSISTTAYAGSILWSSKHVITNLAKDEEWLLSATTEDGEDIDDVEATASDIADSEADSKDSVAFIDATLVMEGTEAVLLEITMDSSTTDEIQEDSVEYAAPEESMDEGVEEINAPIDKTGDNHNP